MFSLVASIGYFLSAHSLISYIRQSWISAARPVRSNCIENTHKYVQVRQRNVPPTSAQLSTTISLAIVNFSSLSPFKRTLHHNADFSTFSLALSINKSINYALTFVRGVVTGDGRGGYPERHLSKGRHIEMWKKIGLSFSVKKGTKRYKKLFLLIFFSFSQLKIESYFIQYV